MNTVSALAHALDRTFWHCIFHISQSKRCQQIFFPSLFLSLSLYMFRSIPFYSGLFFFQYLFFHSNLVHLRKMHAWNATRIHFEIAYSDRHIWPPPLLLILFGAARWRCCCLFQLTLFSILWFSFPSFCCLLECWVVRVWVCAILFDKHNIWQFWNSKEFSDYIRCTARSHAHDVKTSLSNII